ncbi:Activity-regulated cytoskeleton-associated protein [Bienertia sinuspersici]
MHLHKKRIIKIGRNSAESVTPSTWVRTEGRRLVRTEGSYIGSPIHQFPPDTLVLHYFSDADSEPTPQMADAPQNDPIVKLTTMLETLSTRIDTLEKATPNTTKTLEKLVQKATDQYAYHESPELDTELPSKLPEKFSATDLPKFKPTHDPRFHLKGFRSTMPIKGIDPVLYPKVFPLSLDPVCQKCFFSLDDKDIATWEDIAHAFMTRYKGNAQVSTSFRELEILRQEEKEGFTAYLARWKEVAAQMVKTPSEKEMVKIFISSLLPKYREHLKYLGLESFDKVYQIGIEIEDDLIKESDKNKWGNNGHKKNDASTSSKGATNVNTVETTRARWRLAPDPPVHKRHPKWDAGKYCKYHQARGHNT